MHHGFSVCGSKPASLSSSSVILPECKAVANKTPDTPKFFNSTKSLMSRTPPPTNTLTLWSISILFKTGTFTPSPLPTRLNPTRLSGQHPSLETHAKAPQDPCVPSNSSLLSTLSPIKSRLTTTFSLPKNSTASATKPTLLRVSVPIITFET